MVAAGPGGPGRARKGPFLPERSPGSIRSLGAGCAFRNTSYRRSDYDTPSGEFGLPVHYPRFLEWIGFLEWFRSPPAFWRWAPVGGWIICHVMMPLLPPYNCNKMLVSCKPTLTFWTNIRWRCRGLRRGVSGGAAISHGISGCGCSLSSRPTCFRTDGGDVAAFDGSFDGGLRWIRCGSICVWTDFHM